MGARESRRGRERGRGGRFGSCAHARPSAQWTQDAGRRTPDAEKATTKTTTQVHGTHLLIVDHLAEVETAAVLLVLEEHRDELKAIHVAEQGAVVAPVQVLEVGVLVVLAVDEVGVVVQVGVCLMVAKVVEKGVSEYDRAGVSGVGSVWSVGSVGSVGREATTRSLPFQSPPSQAAACMAARSTSSYRPPARSDRPPVWCAGAG